MKIKYLKENFEPIIKNSKNLTEVLIKLDMGIKGKSRNTLKKYINLYNIDTSHFETRKDMYNRSLKICIENKRKSLNEILINDSKYSNTNNLKKKLYRENIKKPICELCGQNEIWHGKKMSLILDHINGINNDHRLENLRIVCPNCNATLSTFAGKNVNHEKNKIIKFASKINKYILCICGKQISRNAKYCAECEKINRRKINRPTYEQLLVDIKLLGYLGTGKKYGVSDNSIRKWIKFYEKQKLPNLDSNQNNNSQSVVC